MFWEYLSALPIWARLLFGNIQTNGVELRDLIQAFHSEDIIITTYVSVKLEVGTFGWVIAQP